MSDCEKCGNEHGKNKRQWALVQIENIKPLLKRSQMWGHCKSIEDLLWLLLEYCDDYEEQS